MADELALWYLKESGGKPDRFTLGLRKGERRGQAFFNALNKVDQTALTGRLVDPFYSNTFTSLHGAVSFLCSRDANNG